MSNYSSVQISCAVPLQTPTTPPPGGLRPPVQQSHPFFDWLNSFSLVNIILCFSIFQILANWKTVRRKSRTHLSELQVANLPWWRVMTSPEEGNLWTSLRYSYISESFIDKKTKQVKGSTVFKEIYKKTQILTFMCSTIFIHYTVYHYMFNILWLYSRKPFIITLIQD